MHLMQHIGSVFKMKLVLLVNLEECESGYVKVFRQIIAIYLKEVLAIRRIFSLVDMITNTKFSNYPNVSKFGVVWQ